MMTKTDIRHVPGIFVTESEIRMEDCFKCGARIGKRCIALDSRQHNPQSHTARINAAITRKEAARAALE